MIEFDYQKRFEGGPAFHLAGRLVFSQTAVTLAALIAGLPLVIRPVKEAFESKTLLDLECAAHVCGATPLTTFLRVTLPTVRNAVLSAFLLGTARASGEVGITMMLGGNVSDKTNTLSLEIYNAVGRGDFDTATTLCAVLAAVALVLYAALELLRRRSDVRGASARPRPVESAKVRFLRMEGKIFPEFPLRH